MNKLSPVWPIIVVLAAADAILCVTLGAGAQAHDWYSTTEDPVFQSDCCGGHDCAPVDPAFVTERADGYQITLSVEEAQKINPTTRLPIDAFVPWERVQSPPDAKHMFYICIFDSDRSAPRNGVICFFSTPSM